MNGFLLVYLNCYFAKKILIICKKIQFIYYEYQLMAPFLCVLLSNSNNYVCLELLNV